MMTSPERGLVHASTCPALSRGLEIARAAIEANVYPVHSHEIVDHHVLFVSMNEADPALFTVPRSQVCVNEDTARALAPTFDGRIGAFVLAGEQWAAGPLAFGAWEQCTAAVMQLCAQIHEGPFKLAKGTFDPSDMIVDVDPSHPSPVTVLSRPEYVARAFRLDASPGKQAAAHVANLCDLSAPRDVLRFLVKLKSGLFYPMFARWDGARWCLVPRDVLAKDAPKEALERRLVSSLN